MKKNLKKKKFGFVYFMTTDYLREGYRPLRKKKKSWADLNFTDIFIEQGRVVLVQGPYAF